MKHARKRHSKKQAQRYARIGGALLMAVLIGGAGYLTVAHVHGEANGLSMLFAQLANTLQPSTKNYDVVVVGAGTGGTAASIQASRMGARVALLEETDWVGGQAAAAGVASMDGGYDSGIYKEFADKMQAYYAAHGKPKSPCAPAKCYEPSVVQKILRQMIANADAQGTLDLYERTKVAAVLKNGNMVTGVRTADGRTFNARVVIDATEYGDMLPLAGVAYRIGNGTNTSPNPNACIQDITYTAVIRKYATSTMPAGLLIKTPPPGYNETIASRFRTVVSKDGHPVMWSGYPYAFPAFLSYRIEPDSLSTKTYSTKQTDQVTKTGINWANDYPAELPYISYPSTGSKLSTRYLDDPVYRKTVNCEAKLKTIQFLYYVQTELGQPSWSVATDEGYDTPYNEQENDCPNIPAELKTIEHNLPVMPYVRESRRMIGIKTITAKDIKRSGTPPVGAVAFPSSVAVGDYGNDLHNCNTDTTLETNLETRSDVSGQGLFQIPLEAFIPKDIDGFVAAEKNISQTRLTSGATRLQPITMMTGQAAGALAALAVKKSVPPRQIKAIDVQRALVQAGAAISQITFSDVPATSTPQWQAVQLVSARGIMIGYGNGKFGANDPMTRAQAAIVIARRFNLDTSNTTSSFADVPSGTTEAGATEALYRAGITVGCSANPLKFCPNDPVTRGQFMAFLGRGLGINNATVPETPYFTDVPKANGFFTYIQYAFAHGWTAGCSANPRKFCPDDPITRIAEAIFLAATIGN